MPSRTIPRAVLAAAVSVVAAGPALAAIDTVTVEKDKTVTVDVTPGLGGTADKGRTYQELFQKEPAWVDIRLKRPVPAGAVRGGPMTFTCDEYGTYRSSVDGRTWQVGKGCVPR